MNEVIVSTLPHPISMFFIGFMLFGAIFTYYEYKKLVTELKQMRENLKETKQQFKEMETRYEARVSEISKKIDSRVDKAVMNLRKN